MSKEKTAIKYLIEKMMNPASGDTFKSVIDKAKKIEKKQLKKMYNIGIEQGIPFDFKNNKSYTFEKYYKENYENI